MAASLPPPSTSSSPSPFPPPPPPPPPPSFNYIPHKKYDVYLSFKGEDTRQNFISHLYTALIQKQINTLVDDQQLIRGDEISPSLLKGIEQSKISVVILSKGYASSLRCLEELLKILECKHRLRQIVIPVFYHVNKSFVFNRTGIDSSEFWKLDEKWSDKRHSWSSTLTEVASLDGFDSDHVRSDSVLVEKIIEDILERLKDTFSSDVNKNLVGMESCIKEIDSLLSYESIDVNTLDIWGMSGIGNTAIASVIFSRISGHFESSFFAQNIREELEKIGGLTHLRWELLSTLLENKNLTTSIPNFSLNFESERLTRKSVLIVFDDVTNYEQIESLIGSLDWFGPGSLIIITTRNKQVLQNCGVKKIYKMKELAIADALMLFSWHAFKQNHLVAGYEELSKKILQYTQGVPLGIKVLGGLLYGKSKLEK